MPCGVVFTILNCALWCRDQGGKQDSFQQWEVVPIEVFDVRQVKNSFKKLMKACVPSQTNNDQNMTFHRCLEESEWMNLVPYTLSMSMSIIKSNVFLVLLMFIVFVSHSFTGFYRCLFLLWSCWTLVPLSWLVWKMAGMSQHR